ncbi:M2 family metallopeptidase [Gloeobacter kilaueensis]|uniref:Peptidyl-dipeptidase A n=1 Tax=Gloeobacter kilaueensis (strain ATCC BAA-2537 / CCAP 1431/1 / ULC 316 / JS1) TaxID=1183438 RepID=U5QLC8_GLOK1|nr:M2 family metallopeptidase [Gloeobacter kilaueensis]AGY58470.1 peptidyl-dipeptidase A [Gloeobacter kilaueensis JS1]
MNRNVYLVALLAALGSPVAATAPASAAPRLAFVQSVAEAQKFMQRAEGELAELNVKANRASWVGATYITDDTEALSADAQTNLNSAIQRFAIEAKRFDNLQMPPELARKFKLLKLNLIAPPPSDSKEQQELTRLTVGMESEYGKGTYCRSPVDGKQECLQLNDLERILRTSRDPKELLDVWQGWHQIARPLRPRYERFVQLSNKGARELGFADTGAMWRSNYDMSPAQFSAEVERLWQQVRPLYLSLHAYVRTKLGEQYGTQLVPADGPIPAHLLGNMWAQEWGNIYPLAAPANDQRGYDLTQLLTAKKVDEREMFRYGERFFTSLGFAPLPKTFWERSMLTKPRDRDVVCHASAWDIDNLDDVRIKMCAEVTDSDFVTIHHELGHNFYQRAYKTQPPLFQNSANDGFHEAVGDTIALSVTPDYLVKVGLLGKAPGPESDTGFLLKQALDKVAFLPFGLLIDQWRWKVFSGETQPKDYNKSWWELRERYQGIAPPLARSEADFDPAAKYHVAANTPYIRYFLARILQFQFHRALCREAGYTGPLHRCSIYANRAAGTKLAAMLAAGQSQPWPDTLYAMTGERQMDASAMLDYFAPLKSWLDAQNQGKKVGW